MLITIFFILLVDKNEETSETEFSAESTSEELLKEKLEETNKSESEGAANETTEKNNSEMLSESVK